MSESILQALMQLFAIGAALERLTLQSREPRRQAARATRPKMVRDAERADRVTRLVHGDQEGGAGRG